MLQGITFAERLTRTQSKGTTSKCFKDQCQVKYGKNNISNNLQREIWFINLIVYRV